MKIEQTKHFISDCENCVRIANENRFSTNREQIAKDKINQICTFRGKDYAVKVVNKANQKAKFKFYNVSDIV